ncbi:uncharacterized protein LOC132197313 isoform X3 [Neocloeon triangulifer]|uniref:uncharacterized protein LOC132197313 isoform X3 n=1 Tax=Neocloeon triangulifer TaxID=2078957 RepID=UPI00286F53EF|nr:uncharacterized protein LOC132197313 isoform X3 [Neocloeon triangulifer]
MEMVRFLWLFLAVVTTELAEDQKRTDQSTHVMEEEEEVTDFQKGLMKIVNETNEKLKFLTSLAVDMKTAMDEQNQENKKNFNETNQRFLELAAIIDEHHKQAIKDNQDLAQKVDERFNHWENVVKYNKLHKVDQKDGKLFKIDQIK